MATSVMWFRRDLRLSDNPALGAAKDAGDEGVVPLFVLDDRLWEPAGPSRRAYLAASLSDLSERVGGMHVVHGDPVQEVVRVARQAGASTVHVAADYAPYGSERDQAVEKALAEHDVELVRTGSPYAVAPGRVLKGDGTPFKVYTPFNRAWKEHGWRAPAADVRDVPWLRPEGRTHQIPDVTLPDGLELRTAGEAAARKQWRDWIDPGLAEYDDTRNDPGADRTSRMSVHLKWGEIHPRTMLADIAEHHSEGADAYQREICFREFYADVLHHNPHTAREYYNPQFAGMTYDKPGDDLEAWKQGRTGFPVVDAGLRQLRAEGWMHNRVRMIVASFLVKDLHLEWQLGARHFLHWLVDGDLASNQHGWQWMAGCGTDAAPYFRIFNPTTQGKKFDPDGAYVRRYVPELADVDAKKIHEPWTLDDGPPNGYPPPLVDHKEERVESLERYQAIK
ncbi:cryptochrome/photolyase family protein [Solicola sp. PLA-1-18]|uniref:cryptochrome/photolyase family protein n=1 Tax=Solicola sp. PLA-1-18 TaxID=3380532 RepID=UPI003B7800F5